MPLLRKIFSVIAVLAITLGWRFFFPAHLTCDGANVQKAVMELLEEGYVKRREEMLSVYPTVYGALPAVIHGELSDIVSDERAKTRVSTSVCHALYKIQGNNTIIESISIDYRVTGQGVFSDAYQVAITNSQAHLSAAAPAMLPREVKR